MKYYNKILFKICIAMILFIVLLTKTNCKKNSTLKYELNNDKVVEVFFKNSETVDLSIQKVVFILKQKQFNDRNFIPNLVKKVGYPNWIKTVSKIKSNNLIGGRITNNSSDTTVLVPFVLSEAKNVNAYIEAHFNDSSYIWLQENINYKNYNYGILNSENKNAEKFTLEFIYLDRKVFGYNSFIIKDSILFKSNLHQSSFNNSKFIKIKFTSNTHNNLSSYVDDPESDCCTEMVEWEAGPDGIRNTEDDILTGESYWEGTCCGNGGNGGGFGAGVTDWGGTNTNGGTGIGINGGSGGGLSGNNGTISNGGCRCFPDSYTGWTDEEEEYIDALGYKRPFNASHFRYNLGIRSGLTSQPTNIEAHHIFPQAFLVNFTSAGIDIHDPNYGQWWPSPDHQAQAIAYNQKWTDFFTATPHPTKAQILAQGKIIMQQYNYTTFY